MTAPRLLVRRLPHACDLPLPSYATAGAAGLDLRAAVDPGEPVIIAPAARALIPTGLEMAIPPGFEGQVRPRSGLAAQHGITVLNTPGTIDCDYRGEVKVILVNLSDTPFEVTRGTRIAQLVVAPIVRAQIEEAGDLPVSVRGDSGFGSTGTS